MEMALASSKVYLDVGGRLFVSSKQTLCKEADSYFGRMFSGDWGERCHDDPQHAIFLDRDPDSFALVLDFLRYGCCDVPKAKHAFRRLLMDVEFFNLKGMRDYLCVATERENPRVHFVMNADDDHTYPVRYKTIVKHSGENSEFVMMVNKKLKEGLGTKQRGIHIELEFEAFQGLIEWLRCGFVSRTNRFLFDELRRYLTKNEIGEGAAAITRLQRESEADEQIFREQIFGGIDKRNVRKKLSKLVWI